MKKHHFKFREIETKLKRKLLQGAISPRPIAWMTTKNSDGSINVGAFSYFNMFNPEIVGVSILKDKGQDKDTYINLIREKEAVIHIADYSLIKEMDTTGLTLPYGQSELELTNLSTMKSEWLNTPTITQAKVTIEVKLQQDIELYDEDHQNILSNLLLLRVVGINLNDEVFDEQKQYVLLDKLNPVTRLAGPNYGLVNPVAYKRQS